MKKILLYMILYHLLNSFVYAVPSDTASYPLVDPPEGYNPWYEEMEFSSDNLTSDRAGSY